MYAYILQITRQTKCIYVRVTQVLHKGHIMMTLHRNFNLPDSLKKIKMSHTYDNSKVSLANLSFCSNLITSNWLDGAKEKYEGGQ